MKRQNKKPKVTVIIPARYASTRFEGKPLADILGKPMIQHVYLRASKAPGIDNVIVATDDERIFDCVTGFGGKAVMTSDKHSTGTDRIAEVAKKLDSDIIVNAQGDEPLLDPGMISDVINPILNDRTVDVVTLMGKLTDAVDFVDATIVKAVTDIYSNILFMSRAPIPYPKSREGYVVYKQIGIYAFRREYLIKFASMRPTPLETIEGVELLRVVENRHILKGALTAHRTFSVDTKSDLIEVTRIMERMGKRPR